MTNNSYIYIRKINGKLIKDKINPNYRIVLGKYNDDVEFTDTSKVFEAMRKYVC
jgi:type IV secretory pathway VirB9-like protein